MSVAQTRPVSTVGFDTGSTIHQPRASPVWDICTNRPTDVALSDLLANDVLGEVGRSRNPDCYGWHEVSHEREARSPMRKVIKVHAKDRNTFVARVAAGSRYHLLAEGQWVDWWIRTTANGFSTPLLRLMERHRRHPSANWFALIGFIASAPLPSRVDLEPLGVDLLDLSAYLDARKDWIAPSTGSMHVFPNDLPGAYWNNKGSITLTVTAAS